MKELTFQEVLFVSGADANEDLIAYLTLLVGVGTAGGVTGHITGSLVAYNAAIHYGASNTVACLAGVAGGAAAIVPFVYLSVKAAETIYGWTH